MPEKLQELKESIAKVVIGKEDVFELLMIGLLTGGHILIEDVPGVGKTLITKALAASIEGDFKRLQCTPDLTPTDVTGFNVYDKEKNSFVFKPGPIMTNILLADEINRAVPRTQASLLEAMEERQVTIDGETKKIDPPFIVVATQNPIEHEGTFPLPEAQLDRFLLKVSMGYPSLAQEKSILVNHGTGNPLDRIKPVANKEDIIRWQAEADKVYVKEELNSYIVDLVRKTRGHEAVSFGASPRASLALYRASKALAFLRGRDFVIPDDIKYLASYILPHRLSLKREERLKGIGPDQIIDEILTSLTVPVQESRDE